jgi:hypothetical protein
MGQISQLSDCLLPAGAPTSSLDAAPMNYADNQSAAGHYPIQPASLNYFVTDPATTVSGSALTAGTPRLSRIFGWKAGTVTNIIVPITAAAVTNSGYVGVALYRESGGNLVLASSSVSQTSAWNSIGNKVVALQVAQAIALEEYFWVGALFVGTTGPNLAAAWSFAGALQANGGNRRSANMAAGSTSFPSPVSMASLTAVGNALMYGTS